jgi:two-component system chemotaxis sensor kinase CheA
MDELLQKVVHLFADEVKEQAQRISAALILMESDRRLIAVQIEEACRQAHSLKGAASSVGAVELESLTHELEEALLRVRRDETALTPALVDIALRAMEACQRRAAGLLAGSAAGVSDVATIFEELRQLRRSRATAPEPADDREAPSPPLGPLASSSALGDELARARSPALVPPEPEPGEPQDTVRVAASHLTALERRLDEARGMRGRLEQRASTAAGLVQAIELVWRQVRGAPQPLQPSLAAARESLYQLLRRAGALRRDLFDDAELTQVSALELDENLRALRMVPAALLQDPLQLALRDACRRTKKEAQLVLAGRESQIDRRVLEELKHPLLHLTRNAVDHGIEPAAVREAMGKPPRGTVTILVEPRGRDVIIEVSDDGRGVDLNQVRCKAVERGLYTEAQAAALDERELHELIFQPGFSTAQVVSELSGRGVGLDVVRDAVLRLHGRVELATTPGRGTVFTLFVPLTLAASEAMLVEEAGHVFALPQANLERIVRARSAELRTEDRRLRCRIDDELLPVVQLAPLLGLTPPRGAVFRTLAVLRSGDQRAALVCERLLGSRDLVLRPLPAELQGLRLLNAAAILPNGQPILVLSARTLVEHAVAAEPPSADVRPAAPPGTILVADDSITSRSLVRHALEASGYRVRTAGDGDEALRLALSEAFDLVVSDLRMPRLDGFELTARLRAHPRTAQLPVILFTSVDNEEDKRRGVAAGANVFLVKSAADRGQLVNVVGSLVRGS